MDEGEVLAGTARGQLEGEPDAALHAHPGIHRPLGGHLVWSSLAQEAALARIGTFCVLPDDDEVTVGRRCSGGPGEGTEIDVEVELETQPQQQAALEQAVGDIGRADGGTHGPEEDGVEGPELVEGGVG